MKKLIITLVCCLSGVANAQNDLPDVFKKALSYVPLNVVSVMGSLEPFEISMPKIENKTAPTFHSAMRNGLLVSNQNAGKADWPFEKLLGKDVEWLIFAKRNQEVLREKLNPSVIQLGIHPYESLTIIRLMQTVPKEFKDDLEQLMDRSVIDANLPVFYAKTGNLSLVMLDAKTLALVTSMPTNLSMLRDVLSRVNEPTKDYVFEGSPAWKLLNTQDTIWSLRKLTPNSQTNSMPRGSDWITFSYASKTPQLGLIRGVLSASFDRDAFTTQHKNLDSVTRSDLGLTWIFGLGEKNVDMRFACLPDFVNRCLVLPFLTDALGIMIWI